MFHDLISCFFCYYYYFNMENTKKSNILCTMGVGNDQCTRNNNATIIIINTVKLSIVCRKKIYSAQQTITLGTNTIKIIVN